MKRIFYRRGSEIFVDYRALVSAAQEMGVGASELWEYNQYSRLVPVN